MPYVACIGTYVPLRWGLSPQVAGSFAGIGEIGYEGLGFPEGSRVPQASRRGGDHCRRGELNGAQISLVHNLFRPTAVSAMTIPEGATHGAW